MAIPEVHPSELSPNKVLCSKYDNDHGDCTFLALEFIKIVLNSLNSLDVL